MCYRVGARLGVDVERWVSDEFLDVWLSSGVKKSKGYVEATLDNPINLMYNERRWQRTDLCRPQEWRFLTDDCYFKDQEDHPSR